MRRQSQSAARRSEYVIHWPLVGVAAGLSAVIVLLLATGWWLGWTTAVPPLDQRTLVWQAPWRYEPRPVEFEPQFDLPRVSRVPSEFVPQRTIDPPPLVCYEWSIEAMPSDPFFVRENVALSRELLVHDWMHFHREQIRNWLDRQTTTLDLDPLISGPEAENLASTRSGTSYRPPDWWLRTKSGATDSAKLPDDRILEIAKARHDLEGVPFLLGGHCHMSAEAAAALESVSKAFRAVGPRRRQMQELRDLVARGDTDESARQGRLRREVERALQRQVKEIEQGLEKHRTNESIPGLVQMLQVEEEPVRLQLVAMLAKIPGGDASRALAQRAVYDVSEIVRLAALSELRQRPAKEYRETLVSALRYPVPVIAYHAAEALAATRQRETLFDLVELLDQPDPQAPFQNENRTWKVRELVRVNHMRNCLLCHASSQDANDPVRGLIPDPSQPLQAEYYKSRSRGTFVRADIVYLRQDFSLMHEVKHPGKWPKWQRFDYFVRVRTAIPEEVEQHLRKSPETVGYPQRDAVLFALRAITGMDAGELSADWRRYLESTDSGQTEPTTSAQRAAPR